MTNWSDKLAMFKSSDSTEFDVPELDMSSEHFIEVPIAEDSE
jgi:hypothetical protein